MANKIFKTTNLNLRKYAQALMLIHYYRFVDITNIEIVKACCNDIIIDELYFKIRNIAYAYKDGKIKVYAIKHEDM